MSTLLKSCCLLIMVAGFTVGCAKDEQPTELPSPKDQVAPGDITTTHKTPQADATAKGQTICPVMGGKINKSLFVDHEGHRVYFCCEGCIDPFKKDPAKYVKDLLAAGVDLDKTPVEKQL